MAWNLDNLPDLTGKVAVITGANSGLGLETTRGLARTGATIVMACRTEAKAHGARDAVLADVPKAVLEFMPLDLASLASIRSFAEAFASKYDQLDLLCNNAGVMALPRSLTADGFEMQIGTNHLGHFALTGLLLDRLKAAEGARIINVASLAHAYGKIDFDDLMGERSYSKWLRYCQSKLANLLFTFECHRRLTAANVAITCAASHPGYSATNLQTVGARIQGSKIKEKFMAMANSLLAQSAAKGALPSLYALTASDLQGGSYIGPDGLFEMHGNPKVVRAKRHARDADVAARLWDVSIELTGIDFGGL
ncbi:MAG: oxidoreductase [Nannocystaceae bacterium]